MGEVTRRVPIRYIPTHLSEKDKKTAKKELRMSRKLYKNKKYYTRKRLPSFKSRTSKHILRARKIYKTLKIKPTKTLAKRTGCSVSALEKIVNKGQGAYFSSGSRPNQTGHSWGYARLASAITGGKSAAIDYSILKEGCKKNSKALRYANKAVKKHNKGLRKTRSVSL